MFDYDSGKPIPVSQFQTRRHSIQPKDTATSNDNTNVSIIARGRCSQNEQCIDIKHTCSQQ